MQHIVMFSGGISTYETARRVKERVDDPSTITLLFADTLIESPELYRFRDAVAKSLNLRLEIVADGRTPFEVFRDERYLGNTRVDPCSKILKRQLLNRWIDEHCDVKSTTIYYGFDWTEQPRIDRQIERRAPWRCEFPLAAAPFEFKDQWVERARAAGLPVTSAYKHGFSHDNCNGKCIKAGQAHCAKLLQVRPEVYLEWEQEEQDFRDFIGKDVSILRDRSGGEVKTLTLRDFRKRLEASRGDFDHQDWGSCTCME